MDNDYLDDISSDEDDKLLNDAQLLLIEKVNSSNDEINVILASDVHKNSKKDTKYDKIDDVVSVISSDEDTTEKPQNGWLNFF